MNDARASPESSLIQFLNALSSGMARFQVPVTMVILGLACEPIAPLGKDEFFAGLPLPASNSGGMGGRTIDGPRIIESGGHGGAGLIALDTDQVLENVCSTAYLGEAHEEPSANCREMTPVKQNSR